MAGTKNCKTCKRVIYVEHGDEEGNCCFCQKKPEPKPWSFKREKTKKEEEKDEP